MRMRTALPLGTLLLALVGCGEKAPVTTPAPVTSTQTRNAPAWIDNEEIPDGLAAVGIAQANVMGDKSMQRTTAIADARTKLAGKLKVRVQNMFSQLNQQVTHFDPLAQGEMGRHHATPHRRCDGMRGPCHF